ncbi:MAG: hypothetical protein QG559_671 [Campylobacterota bacterium]|nr:hypothetical protein [Campylobacterota bacterium]
MITEEEIPWDKNYSVGIKNIDTQHQKLFSIVNRLYLLEENSKNLKEELRTILHDFSDYTRTHFQEEEDYMRSIGYDKLQEHIALHEELIDYLNKIIKTPANLNIIKAKIKVISKRALVHHIINEDIKIKHFLESKEIQIQNSELEDITNFMS